MERNREYSQCRPAPQAEPARSFAWSVRWRRQDLARQVDRQGDRPREFVRVSLGGVRDEAEIRGHRAPISARMPQDHPVDCARPRPRIRSSCSTRSTRWARISAADPSSALLRFSTEQNHTFNDHYLEVDYDLSNVMFITTANTLKHPAAADGPHGDHPRSRYTGR